MDCDRASEVMYLFFDDGLGDDLRAPLQEHLDACGRCADRLSYTRKLLLIVRQRCVRHHAPGSLRERIRVSLQA